MRLLLSLYLVLCTQIAASQELPELFEVIGLSDGDVMNMRVAPSPEAQLVGALTPNVKYVEVLERSEDGHWVLISANREDLPPSSERWGWIYFDSGLVPVPTPQGVQTDFDRRLWCSGVKPFWTLAVDPNTGVNWQVIGAEVVSLDMIYASRSPNLGRTNQMMFALSSDVDVTVALHHQQCWVGMGDSVSGFSIQVLENRSGTYQFVSGCCSLLDPGW